MDNKGEKLSLHLIEKRLFFFLQNITPVASASLMHPNLANSGQEWWIDGVVKWGSN